MALRELLLSLGVEVDKAGVKKADNALAKIKKAAIAVTAVFVAGKGILKILELGSAANETSNVIQAAFGDAGDAVEEWAKRQAKAMGRSRFELREMAAATGAIIGPMVGAKDVAADMATKIAELAVDLGSFFNANDPDALRALQSGLIGSTEPMLKFGVVMLQSNLQAFALSKGIKTLVKDMNEAEKVTLRYEFIMAKTKQAQGDAAKTATGYANATKALKAAIKDSLTEIGKKLLPTVEKLLAVMIPLAKLIGQVLVVAFEVLGNIIGAVVGTFGELNSIFEVLIVTMGAMGLALFFMGKKSQLAARQMLIAWIKTTAPFLLIALLIGLIFLAIEDLIVFMKGGDSVIGKFVESFKKWIDEMGGVTGAIRNIFEKLFTTIFGLTKENAKKVTTVFLGIGFAIKESFVAVGTFIGETLAKVFLAIEERIDQIVGAIQDALAALTGAETRAEKRTRRTKNERIKADFELKKANLRDRGTRRKQDAESDARFDALIARGLKTTEILSKAGLSAFISENGKGIPSGLSAFLPENGTNISGAASLFRETQNRTSQTINNTPINVTVDASGQLQPTVIGDRVATGISKAQDRRQAAQAFQTAKQT